MSGILCMTDTETPAPKELCIQQPIATLAATFE